MVTQVSLLARGATRRAQLSYPQRLPTLDPSSTAATVRLLRSLGALRSTRQQVRIPASRDAITAAIPCCECMRWDVTYTHVFLRSEKGCKIRVTHVHACSDCVLTRDDTDRLTYASRFVRVIHSSHIVSIKLGTVTPLRRCGLAVHERQDGPASAVLPALVQVVLPARLLAVLPACLPAMQLCYMPSSLEQRCPHPRGSRSGGATRTRPCGATRTRPCGATRTRHPFHATLAVPSARATSVPRTRLNVASPASVTLHSIAQIARPALGPTLVIVGQTSARFTSPSPAWRLMEDRSSAFCAASQSALSLLPSLLVAVLMTASCPEHVAAVLPANISELSR